MIANSMKLTVPARSGNEYFVRSAAAAFCMSLNPTLETINDIKTAVSEAVTNVVVHAYENLQDKYVYVEAELHADALLITVKDTGRGIADINQAMQPMYTTKPDKERSGMGFTFMQTFMDEVEVKSSEENGTQVIMKKYIAPQMVSVAG